MAVKIQSIFGMKAKPALFCIEQGGKIKNILAYGVSGQEKLRTHSLDNKTECSFI